MEEFNNKKMTAAVQEAERLVRELETTTLEVKDLDEEAEYFMKKYEMEAEARGRLERHLAILRNILEERKSWPRGKPTSTTRKYLYRAHRPPPTPSPPLLAALRRRQHLQRRQWLVLPVRAWARPFSPPPLPPSSPPPSLMHCVFHVSHRKRPRLGGVSSLPNPHLPWIGSAPLPQTPMPQAGSGQAIITDPTHGGQSISPHPPLPPTVGRRTIRALYFPLPRPSIVFPRFTPQIGDQSMAPTQHLGEF